MGITDELKGNISFQEIGPTRSMTEIETTRFQKQWIARQARAREKAADIEAKGKEKAEKIKRSYKYPEAKALLLQQRVGAVRAGMDVVDWIKPMLFVALGLFVILGPGLTAVSVIFQAFTWYYWVIGIFLSIILWRRFH